MTGPVWYLWHGGSSYGPGYVDEHTETADSVADVIDELDSRFWNRDGRTPAVDETSGALIWFADPRGVDDPYPDLVVDMVAGAYVTSPA